MSGGENLFPETGKKSLGIWHWGEYRKYFNSLLAKQ
jgi:hypothetical protein